MSEANAPQGAAADNPGNNAGEWAKTVAEGVPGDAGAPPPPAPVGNVTPDDVLDAAGGDTTVAKPSAEDETAADPGQQETDDHQTMNEQTDNVDTEAEAADAESAEQAEAEAEAEAEATDAENADAEVIDAELVEDEADAGNGDGPETDGPDTEGPNAEGSDTEGSDADGSNTDDAAAAEAIDSAFDDMSVEDLVLDLERVTTERDQYLDASRRLQAEFENYKKQVGKREATARDRANDSLISELLPVLDAFDGALANGAEDVAPMRTSFLDALGKQGLERVDPAEQPFDPNLHEAVLHEDASDVDAPVVAEVMRAGYVWKGRVLRPAMVKTRG